MTDKEIIELVLQGDTDAFRWIVERYRDMVLRISARILCDRDAAEDIAQETFVRAWTSIRRYSSRYSLATWLRTIACRLCYDELRSAGYSSTIPLSAEEVSSGAYARTAADSESAYIWKESLMTLRRVTASLSPMQRTVFVLHEIEAMSADEIAQATGLSKLQIKSNLYFARKAVRDKIKSEDIAI